jgi:DNA-directed RNA polymerase subunit RPC12/RpoP
MPCFACSSKFKTTSGVVQHVEGDCQNLLLNRNQITATVQSLDVGSKISLRSIGGSSSTATPFSRPLLTYDQPAEISPDGTSYQCHICYKMFQSPSSLDAHLNSPAHDKDEFKCPRCNTQFKLVSGLVQHLESASCGLSNVDDVERRFNMLPMESGLQALQRAPRSSQRLTNLIPLSNIDDVEPRVIMLPVESSPQDSELAPRNSQRLTNLTPLSNIDDDEQSVNSFPVKSSLQELEHTPKNSKRLTNTIPLSNLGGAERTINMLPVESSPQELEPAPQDSKRLANLTLLCLVVCLWLIYMPEC